MSMSVGCRRCVAFELVLDRVVTPSSKCGVSCFPRVVRASLVERWIARAAWSPFKIIKDTAVNCLFRKGLAKRFFARPGIAVSLLLSPGLRSREVLHLGWMAG